MNPEPADLLDRLDLSMSSIDMTNTSLAMHEEKEGEISGVGKWKEQQSIPHCTHHTLLLAVNVKPCFAEELDDSELHSSSSPDTQPEPQQLSTQAAMDLSSALDSTDNLSDSGVPPAEPSDLESTDLLGSLGEPSDSPSPPTSALEPPADDPPPSPPAPAPAVELLPSSSVVDEPAADDNDDDRDDSPTQADADAAEPFPVLSSAEEPIELQDEAPAQHCEHESDKEEPEEPALE